MVLSVLFLFCFFSQGYAQSLPAESQASLIQGSIADIDWVAGKLVVRSDDFYSSDEMIFVADRNTKIIKGTETISLADILQGDHVKIVYRSSLAGLRALQITVNK